MKNSKLLAIILSSCILFSMTSCAKETHDNDVDNETTQEESSTTTYSEPESGVYYVEYYRLDQSKEYIQEIDGITMELIDCDGNINYKITNNSEETFVVNNDFQLLRLDGDEYVDTYLNGFDNPDEGDVMVRFINGGIYETLYEDKLETIEVNPGDTLFVTYNARSFYIDEVGEYKFVCSGFEITFDIVLDWVC